MTAFNPSSHIDLDTVDGAIARALIEDSHDCIKILDTEGHLRFMSRNGLCAMEIDDFASVRGACWWDLWPREHRTLLRAAVESAVRGGFTELEANCPTAKGTPKWWRLRVSPVPDGALRHMVVVASEDITNRVHHRREAEQRRAEAAVLRQTARLFAGELAQHIETAPIPLNAAPMVDADAVQATLERASRVFSLLGEALEHTYTDGSLSRDTRPLVQNLRALADMFEREGLQTA